MSPFAFLFRVYSERKSKGAIPMKKAVLIFGAFAVVFVFTFAVLSLGLKLSTNPADYVIQSVRHMFWQKSIVSFVTGSVAGIIAFMINKKR